VSPCIKQLIRLTERTGHLTAFRIAHRRCDPDQPHRSLQEVAALLEEGVFDMTRLAEGGWVDGLRYEDEVLEDVKKRTGRKEKEQVRGGVADALRGAQLPSCFLDSLCPHRVERQMEQGLMVPLTSGLQYWRFNYDEWGLPQYFSRMNAPAKHLCTRALHHVLQRASCIVC